MDATPQEVELSQMKNDLERQLREGEIPKADREMSYWERIREMVDDVRSHAATRLDVVFAGGVKVSVYRLDDHQVRIDIQE